MKRCFKCGEVKSLSCFYKHKKMADGHFGKCKVCAKSDANLNRERNLDRVREYDRNRPNKAERSRITSERTQELYKNDKCFRERVLESKSRWSDKNVEKRKSHAALNNALRGGAIFKKDSCEHCGVLSEELDGHHWSYKEEHWLDVIWLCKPCHGEEHRRINEEIRQLNK